MEKSVNIQKVRIARVWCVTSLKVPARTHIAHIFEKSFHTHRHTCDRTSHTCVCARTFATHALLITNHFNLYFRLTNWQIVQNVIVTYLGYQDIMKDVFLFAKLILSLKVATIVSDPCVCHDFATIVSFFLKIILVFN